jgi:glycogen phosphorylase
MHSLDSPDALRAALHAIAANLWFSWLPGARELFDELDPAAFAAADHNPVELLAVVSDERLAAAAASGYAARVERALGAIEAERSRHTWWEHRDEDARFGVGYFSLEFGVDESLPVYSGGLGVLAGDHLKSASDLGVPLVGVGLFYREGYFRQVLDASGRQEERYPAHDPSRLPLSPERPVVTVELADRQGELVPVQARAWRADVGRVPLYLLDTDVDGNPEWARSITDKLYGGDRRHRLHQELVLGIGGVRLLRALGIEPTVFHMNEGHSAFLQLERLRELVEDARLTRDDGLERLCASTVFTTHTPVPAGNEVFAPALVEESVGPLVERCGFDWDEFAALGRVDVGDAVFGLTPFALRTAAHANGVSALHGEVSRDLWRAVYPGSSVDAVPIGSVTNGVHARTWLADELDALLESDDETGAPDVARVYELTDDALWSAHREAKRRLVQRVTRRGLRASFDEDALTIGFARRFATYKRADLLFSRPDRLAALLADPERPLQIVLAGKAHPADEGGKALLQKVVAFARSAVANGRVIFVPDYDLTLARQLVQGVDLWLNTPRRPLEASGTSGMKAALNGTLNCSILDGWWHEGYSSDAGFAIRGDADISGDEAQDEADADALFAVLEREVIPTYYDDRGRWIELMRNSIAQLGGRFNTNRMLVEYVEGLYLPAHREHLARLAAA